MGGGIQIDDDQAEEMFVSDPPANDDYTDSQFAEPGNQND